MTNDQYALRPDGRTVDLDIERVFEYLLDEDYDSDPLLSPAFWVIVKTYFTGTISQVTEFAVGSLVSMDLIRGLLMELGVRYEVVTPDDPQVEDNLLAGELTSKVELYARIHTKFGWTHFVPGSSLGHALTLSVIEAARELSELSLNPMNGAH